MINKFKRIVLIILMLAVIFPCIKTEATDINQAKNNKNGIDVSKWQGNIDWNVAKKAGVKFAIIRVGGRYTESGGLYEDVMYKKNIEGALAAGIQVGVYFFSQAITQEEAIEEANYLIARVYKYKITLPLVIDYEYAGVHQGRLYAAGLSTSQATNNCMSFCKTVKAAGYTRGKRQHVRCADGWNI